MGRSAAYWAANLYPDQRQEPRPSAPYRDLAAPAAARFRRVREGLLALEAVAEHRRFMGPTWRWTWEYAVGHRKLCWLHVVQGGTSATFTVSDTEERLALAIPKLSVAITNAINSGQRTGPVRWCFLELVDQKSVDVFLGFTRRKLGWIVAESSGSPVSRRSLAG